MIPLNRLLFLSLITILLIPCLANAASPPIWAEALYQNDIILKDGQDSSGVSAFLLSYEGKKCAVTAKHMRNHMMGDPPVLESHCNQKIQSCEITSLAGKTNLTVTDIVHPDDNWSNDILTLNVKPQEKQVDAFDIPNKNLTAGNDLYIVDCFYEEVSCKQNIYKLVYVDRVDDIIIFD